MALTDAAAAGRPAAGRGRASCCPTGPWPPSTALISLIVAAGHAGDLPAIVDRFVELASAERQQRASPRSAARSRSTPRRPSASPRRSARATGKSVEVKVIVDPSVLGGIVARVGDTVIDGTVRHRLEQLKEQI